MKNSLKKINYLTLLFTRLLLQEKLQLTLYERAVEPLDVVAVGVEDEHLIAGDGHGQEKSGADADRESSRAEPEADPVDRRLVLVDREEVVLAAPPAEAWYKRIARYVKYEEEQQEDLWTEKKLGMWLVVCVTLMEFFFIFFLVNNAVFILGLVYLLYGYCMCKKKRGKIRSIKSLKMMTKFKLFSYAIFYCL